MRRLRRLGIYNFFRVVGTKHKTETFWDLCLGLLNFEPFKSQHLTMTFTIHKSDLGGFLSHSPILEYVLSKSSPHPHTAKSSSSPANKNWVNIVASWSGPY
jgi:hypothetical protein